METRWVGFDLDECIGSVMPLYAFVKYLPAGRPRETLKELLFKSESAHFTWLIRPAIYYALQIVYRAWKSGAIVGAFIFSNNGSRSLVKFIAEYLNFWLSIHFSDSDAKVFKMAVARDSSLRTPGSLDKSFSEVQKALSGSGLPLLTSGTDLIFFDDMVHVLTGEIKDYVQVRPYFNQCPIERVITALAGCEATVGKESWDKIVEKARHFEKVEEERERKSFMPTPAENAFDRNMFLQALKRFLGPAFPMKGGGKTRRRKRKARKNTLRLK